MSVIREISFFVLSDPKRDLKLELLFRLGEHSPTNLRSSNVLECPTTLTGLGKDTEESIMAYSFLTLRKKVGTLSWYDEAEFLEVRESPLVGKYWANYLKYQ